MVVKHYSSYNQFVSAIFMNFAAQINLYVFFIQTSESLFIVKRVISYFSIKKILIYLFVFIQTYENSEHSLQQFPKLHYLVERYKDHHVFWINKFFI